MIGEDVVRGLLLHMLMMYVGKYWDGLFIENFRNFTLLQFQYPFLTLLVNHPTIV